MAKRKVPSEHEGNVSVATEVVGGGEDVGVISPRGMVEAATSALKPIAMARESARLYGEWLKILWGSSTREVPVKDWRFADPTWREHPMYKRLAQGYLAFCDAIDKVVDDNPDWRKRERARFLTGILTSTMAPTNTLIGNPAALKKAYETGGKSLVRGAQNMIGDLRHNKGMPSQVKRSDFKVGENLAASPGAVVLRTERFELLQYQPATDKVYEIPTLIVPPPIGKHYFIDLSPGRSFVEYATAKGFPLFIITWRNPHKEQGDWASTITSGRCSRLSTRCARSAPARSST
jgi:polyhydroxyalkanoate synthase